MIQKLNCMYFVARKVSLPTVDFMLKKERSDDKDGGLDMYKGFSQQLNDLINMYFAIEQEGIQSLFILKFYRGYGNLNRRK